MTTFEDGPAKGQSLMLTRTPIMLRVTEEVLPNGTSKFDALNQIGDCPSPYETLHAYTLVGVYGTAFVDGPKYRGRVAMACYKLTKTQPTAAEMRDETLWHNWCVKNDPRKAGG